FLARAGGLGPALLGRGTPVAPQGEQRGPQQDDFHLNPGRSVVSMLVGVSVGAAGFGASGSGAGLLAPAVSCGVSAGAGGAAALPPACASAMRCAARCAYGVPGSDVFTILLYRNSAPTRSALAHFRSAAAMSAGR